MKVTYHQLFKKFHRTNITPFYVYLHLPPSVLIPLSIFPTAIKLFYITLSVSTYLLSYSLHTYVNMHLSLQRLIFNAIYTDHSRANNQGSCEEVLGWLRFGSSALNQSTNTRYVMVGRVWELRRGIESVCFAVRTTLGCTLTARGKYLITHTYIHVDIHEHKKGTDNNMGARLCVSAH